MKAFRMMLALAFLLLYMQGFSQKKQKQEAFSKVKKLYQQQGYGAALDIISSEVNPFDATSNLSPRLFANSYRLIGDSYNAEYWYSEMVKKEDSSNFSESINSNPKDLLYYAQALQCNGKYDEAKRWFLKYSDAVGNDDGFGKRLAESCDAAAKVEADQGVIIKNMENLNSKKLDFSPAFFENGIVFTSTRSTRNKIARHKDLWLNDNFMDLYFAKVEAGETASSTVSTFNKINNKYHDGTATFSQDGNMMYFARSNSKKRKRKKDKKGITRLKIYQAQKGEEGWESIQELLFNSDEFNSCHPTLSEDGNVLFFSSNRPEGFGGMDLYRSHRVGTSWSKPENLGAAINTEGNEVFPFIHQDGMLYFSSNGLPGMGGLDLFRTQEIQGGNFQNAWAKPVNMGKPINTKKDDFGLIVEVSGTEGYFTSSRKGGKGMDDIYHVFCQKGIQNIGAPIAKSIFALADLLIVDVQTNEPLRGVNIRIFSMGKNKRYEDTSSEEDFILELRPLDRSHEKYALHLSRKNKDDMLAFDNQYLTGGDGRFRPSLAIDGKYRFRLEKEGYEPLEYEFSYDDYLKNNKKIIRLKKLEKLIATNNPLPNPMFATGNGYAANPSNSTNIVNYWLSGSEIPEGYNNTITSRIEAGKTIEIKNIFFPFNQSLMSSINDVGKYELDKIVTLLNAHPLMKIEIGAHTDSRGKKSYNKILSQRRANAAVEYIVKKGIEKNRILAIGYGESVLRNYCKDGVDCPEEAHRRNRRIEFKVLGFDKKEVDVRYIENVPER